MKRITLIITFILLIVLNNLYSQNAVKQIDSEYPVEDLTIHLSQKIILPGEVIWFKIYCTSPLYPEVELSRMAYIELSDSKNEALLREKIILNKGVGNGEFIIPEDTPTGIYYFKAYTKWMKNFGKEYLFKTRITIINPNEKFDYQVNSEENAEMVGLEKPIEEDVVQSLIVKPDKKEYATREKVKIKIETNQLSGEGSHGSYSISVSRKEPLLHSKNELNISRVVPDKPTVLSFLPDYKGIVLTGNITYPSGKPVVGEQVILSYPGSGTDINSTKTGANGNFNFLLQSKEGEKDVVFTLPKPNLKLRLEEPFWNEYDKSSATDILKLDNQALSFLKERYFYFQLQKKFRQQYFKKSTSTELVENNSSLFYAKPEQLIELSKYIKLDSITEYFWELIPSVKFLNKRAGFDIQVIDPVTYMPYKNMPGVFVDGVLYPDFNEIAAIPVDKLRQIAVIPKTYYYRDFTFGGIVDIHTKENDFNSVNILPQMLRVLYPLGTSSETTYRAPDYYNNKMQNRIPDLRYLICWKPNIVTNDSGENFVEFYTSDIEGEYEIKLVGVSNDGVIQHSGNRIIVKAR